MLKRAQSLLLNTALAVALLAGAVAVAAETGLIVTERPLESASSSLGPTPRISVRGHVAGLYPGAVKAMDVKVLNRFPQRVELVSVRARVDDASAPCRHQNIRVQRFKGRRAIAARGETEVPVKVRMAITTPDVCQGARFPISFTATVKGQGQSP